jgi:flagellar L-ring protein precursor FlgH
LKLADARLAYSGTGELADSNTAGWLTRFFLSPLLPF